MLRKIIPVYKIYLVDCLLCLISAIILSLSFCSLQLSFLAWFGLIPLFFALENKSIKESFFLAYICGVLFFVFSMYWLINVTPAGWIILSLYQGIYFGAFGISYGILSRQAMSIRKSVKFYYVFSSAKAYIIIPSMWVVLEYLRSRIGGGIGWNLLAYSQYEYLPIIQIADITGAFGVSFLIILVNFALFAGIRMSITCQKINKALFVKSKLTFKQEIKTHPLFQVSFVLIIILSVLIYGNSKISAFNDYKEYAYDIKASVVQGNIMQLYKWDLAYRNYILSQYKQLTLKAAEANPDIIIWPETSLPGYPGKEKPIMRYIQYLARDAKVPILIGAPVKALKGRREIADYNSALLLSKKGDIINQYNKLHLVIFGEFIPLSGYFPWLYKIFPITGNFIPGSEYTVFNLPISAKKEASFSALICFEDIFPGLVRRFVMHGADFMVNMTNDAWFGKTCALYQHAANSVFRAVENRRPFIRSANTGFSCFIDRTGRASDSALELFKPGYITSLVRIGSDKEFTFYTRFGDIFVLLCLVAVVLFLIDYTCLHKYNS